MSSEQDRPLWPYALGAFGGAVFAVGAFLLYVLLQSHGSGGSGQYALTTLAIGGAILGVGWIGVLKYEQGGFGAVSGCFAVTLALIYVYLHRNDWNMFAASGTMVLLAFTWFALGHLFARGVRMTKFAAGSALIGILGEVYGTVSKVRFDRSTDQALALVMCIGLAATGVACAFELFFLRRATDDVA